MRRLRTNLENKKMTKCIYCGQYGEQYKPCPFCGAPSSYDKDMEAWKQLARAGYRTPYDFTDIPAKNPHMSEEVDSIENVYSVNVSALNVRNSPSFFGKIVRRLHWGDKVLPSELKKGWYKVGTKAWVYGACLRKCI